jgi:hypothetical protein
VQRGTGVTVWALPGGEPFFLRDRMFSSSVRRLDLFIHPRLLALPVPVDRGERIELLDLLERRPSAQELAEFVPRPEAYLQNADGHDYYDAEAVADNDGRQASRGQVTREGRRWTLSANSRERLAGLAGIVRQAAPGAREVSRTARRMGGAPARRAKTVMVESFLFTPGTDPESEGPRGHTRAWADATIDTLGMTPREAARAGGRARDGLEMLLDDLQWRENRQAEAGDPPLMDVAWARRELVLAVATRLV